MNEKGESTGSLCLHNNVSRKSLCCSRQHYRKEEIIMSSDLGIQKIDPKQRCLNGCEDPVFSIESLERVRCTGCNLSQPREFWNGLGLPNAWNALERFATSEYLLSQPPAVRATFGASLQKLVNQIAGKSLSAPESARSKRARQRTRNQHLSLSRF